MSLIWLCIFVVVSILALPHMALLSIQATSPERRFTQKEIIAGEECATGKYLLIKQHQDSVSSGGTNAKLSAGKFMNTFIILFKNVIQTHIGIHKIYIFSM